MAALTTEQILQVVAYLAENGVKISDLTAASALTGDELLEIVQGGASRKVSAQDIADLSTIEPSGKLTITPVVTSSGGSCGDMDIMWTKQGNNITMHFFARTFTIEDTTTTTTITVDLASTAIAPTSNFVGGNQYTGNFGSASIQTAEGNVQETSLGTVIGTKKFQFTVNLVAAASGDFVTTIGGSIAFEIVPS